MTGKARPVECPHCDHRYETHETGDREACPECDTVFNRFTNTIGAPDGDEYYEAIHEFITDAQDAGVDFDAVIVPQDRWYAIRDRAEAGEHGGASIEDVRVRHKKYQSKPEAVVEIDV